MCVSFVWNTSDQRCLFDQYTHTLCYIKILCSKVIYLVTCGLCQKQYVGKTEQTLRQRFLNLDIISYDSKYEEELHFAT